MLLINCERKGGPFQTPKIPRKHIIKAAVVQPVPPVSLPRPGVEGKIAPAARRSLYPKWACQEARP